ncbi:hypothetical protein PTSG_06808 [Salpingoeca rosetta]|uniref:Fukutin-related protein n=1 Tax=Salpingoeca rosetta (strain ATCC 50818 / BSB-021) TaxID=946362 RepID=F2UEV4_SALR5|nr:uncharacterized protein PTSG_06808 [Salpingoeca rosetta]EGD75154.1 hypothetical protein PTSG_06808 [Salpingoeca rosetta]|eukprot:XP_004992207.1 hypothetical protein PTSG_06808 [Salpingoeca rosetta]
MRWRQGLVLMITVVAFAVGNVVLLMHTTTQVVHEHNEQQQQQQQQQQQRWRRGEDSADLFAWGATQDMLLRVSVLMRDFELWTNDVAGTIEHAVAAVDPIARVQQVVVAAPRLPYPPITVPRELQPQTQVVSTALGIFEDSTGSLQSRDIRFTGDLVLAVVDGLDLRECAADVSRWISLHRQRLLQLRNRQDTRADVAGRASRSCFISFLHAMPRTVSGTFECSSALFDVKRWTLRVSTTELPRPPKGVLAQCNYTAEVQTAVLADAETLRLLRWDELEPMSRGLLLQAHAKQCTIEQYVSPHLDVPNRAHDIFNTPHLQDKHVRYSEQRAASLYQQLGIKRVQHPSLGTEEWYGCHKNSARCFGTVVHDTPEYIFQGRWTPPCCLENIRKTARYLFRVLNAAGVRYWLEGGTLLGAVRHGDIIEWDYDCDVGIFLDDVAKVPELSHAATQGSHETADGFVWEKAREGDFFRVQFSKFNHLHVDIFPFYEKDGVMTKDTWMESHRQDMEFPSSYLHPLDTITFVGVDVRIPNRAREFLEMKFGPGCIEHPRLPGPSA